MLEWLRERKVENPAWFWAVIVLVCWTVIVAAIGFFLGFPPLGMADGPWLAKDRIFAMFLGLVFALVMEVVLALPAWGALAIAWRRPVVGGLVLSIEGLLLVIATAWPLTVGVLDLAELRSRTVSDTLFCGFSMLVGLLFGGLPLVVGILLLVAAWRRSRKATPPQDME
jgi:hypothetical protein